MGSADRHRSSESGPDGRRVVHEHSGAHPDASRGPPDLLSIRSVSRRSSPRRARSDPGSWSRRPGGQTSGTRLVCYRAPTTSCVWQGSARPGCNAHFTRRLAPDVSKQGSRRSNRPPRLRLASATDVLIRGRDAGAGRRARDAHGVRPISPHVPSRRDGRKHLLRPHKPLLSARFCSGRVLKFPAWEGG